MHQALIRAERKTSGIREQRVMGKMYCFSLCDKGNHLNT